MPPLSFQEVCARPAHDHQPAFGERITSHGVRHRQRERLFGDLIYASAACKFLPIYLIFCGHLRTQACSSNDTLSAHFEGLALPATIDRGRIQLAIRLEACAGHPTVLTLYNDSLLLQLACADQALRLVDGSATVIVRPLSSALAPGTVLEVGIQWSAAGGSNSLSLCSLDSSGQDSCTSAPTPGSFVTTLSSCLGSSGVTLGPSLDSLDPLQGTILTAVLAYTVSGTDWTFSETVAALDGPSVPALVPPVIVLNSSSILVNESLQVGVSSAYARWVQLGWGWVGCIQVLTCHRLPRD